MKSGLLSGTVPQFIIMIIIVVVVIIIIIIIIIIYHVVLFAKYSQTNIESMVIGWVMHVARTKLFKNSTAF
jgi:hypothetical protein